MSKTYVVSINEDIVNKEIERNMLRREDKETLKNIEDFLKYILDNPKEQMELQESILVNKLKEVDRINREKTLIEKLRIISDTYNSNLINWSNISQPKYYININYDKNLIEVKRTTHKQIGVVYFLTKEAAYKAFDLLRDEFLELV